MDPCRRPPCEPYSPIINIYTHPDFVAIPLVPTPPPPSIPLYQPTGPCNQPYPTPTYVPPAPSCGPCRQDS